MLRNGWYEVIGAMAFLAIPLCSLVIFSVDGKFSLREGHKEWAKYRLSGKPWGGLDSGRSPRQPKITKRGWNDDV